MTVHPQDRFRPEGGPLLHVDDAGGMGLPVLFQHGLCGDSRQTAEVFPADDRLRRITLECRGHGASEAGCHSAFTIPQFAQDAAELIGNRQLAPLVIGGISMGAAIATRLAVFKPHLVRGLVIARPAWSTSPSPDNMKPNAEVGTLLSCLPRDAARAAFVSSETARRLGVEAPDNLASLINFFDRKPSNVTAALLKSISADGPGVTAEQMRLVMVPTLVIGTRMDSIHPLAIAEEIASLIPHARLVEITSKAKDRDRYRTEFQSALDQFLKGFLQ